MKIMQNHINKYHQRMLFLVYNDGFQAEVSNIRASWSIPSNGFDSLENGVKCIKEQSSNDREFEFLDEVSRLVTRYNLPSNWDTGVMCYLLTGDENLMLATLAIPSEERISSEPGSNEVTVTLDKFTSLEDIKAIWPEVNRLQRELADLQSSKQQTVQNIDRYVRVKRLQQDGMTHSEIADLISKEFDEILSEEDVSRYIYRFNKLSSKYYDANQA